MLVVISGPSGVGKTSVVERLAKIHPFHFSVSVTTRDSRPGEVEGADYFFVDRDRFRRRVDEGFFLEWAEYSGGLYGTPREEVFRHLDRGEDVVLDIEINGARQVREAYPEAMLIFIIPPSLDVLAQRLKLRGDTSGEDLDWRLGVVRDQMKMAEGLFDHFVVNDDLDRAVEEVAGILRESKETSHDD